MRLIDADALKKYLDDCEYCKNCPKETKRILCYHTCPFPDYCDDEWQRVIDEQPTIEEHKTGRWSINEAGVVRCPFCHANMNPRKNRKPKYCDECGAKMEGAEE